MAFDSLLNTVSQSIRGYVNRIMTEGSEHDEIHVSTVRIHNRLHILHIIRYLLFYLSIFITLIRYRFLCIIFKKLTTPISIYHPTASIGSTLTYEYSFAILHFIPKAWEEIMYNTHVHTYLVTLRNAVRHNNHNLNNTFFLSQ